MPETKGAEKGSSSAQKEDKGGRVAARRDQPLHDSRLALALRACVWAKQVSHNVLATLLMVPFIHSSMVRGNRAEALARTECRLHTKLIFVTVLSRHGRGRLRFVMHVRCYNFVSLQKERV